MRREGRSEDDGYRNDLVPGLRASADADRLAMELAFAAGRLLALAANPPGLYGEAALLAADDTERASWICFLTAYLSPLEATEEDPFTSIRELLAAYPQPPGSVGVEAGSGVEIDLDTLALGARSSHAPGRGTGTLVAYGEWVQRSGGTQVAALAGDPSWTAERRFERLFERLALPGFSRAGRYELLTSAGRLGLFDLRADSLHLLAGTGEDPATVAAKRVFGIGDPLLLDRRARALADEAGTPIEALDLALVNWAAPERATLGFPDEVVDEAVHDRAVGALAA